MILFINIFIFITRTEIEISFCKVWKFLRKMAFEKLEKWELFPKFSD